MMLGILITNFGNVVTEFIGIATSLELFGLSRYVTVPVCGVIVWLIVVKGQYKSVEKVFLAASFFYVTYIFAGALAHPAWKVATIATFKPPEWAKFREQAYLYMVIWGGGNDDRRLGCSSIFSPQLWENGHAAWTSGFALG